MVCLGSEMYVWVVLLVRVGGVNKQKSGAKRPQSKNESKEKQSIPQAPPKNPRKLRSSGEEPDRQKDDSFSLRRANSGEIMSTEGQQL